jgi:hypothetical protein
MFLFLWAWCSGEREIVDAGQKGNVYRNREQDEGMESKHNVGDGLQKETIFLSY